MVSIIIPVYNEALGIERFINYLESVIEKEDAEVIFVDGGSSDKTVQICKSKGYNVLLSKERSRAKQMNFGAEKSIGEILFFLHSDSYPPNGFLKNMEDAVTSGYSAGCYQLQFKPSQIFLNTFAWFTRFDIDVFRFGDQGLFVKREVFFDIGKFDERLLVMEDQEIVRSIKRSFTFKVLDKKIITSSRKYLKIGVLKLQIVFTLIVIMHYVGVRQKTIMDFYKHQL